MYFEYIVKGTENRIYSGKGTGFSDISQGLHSQLSGHINSANKLLWAIFREHNLFLTIS